MEYTDEQVCESWKYISHINKLRKGSVFTNNFDAEYLIVTNTKCTLNISREQTERAKKENGLDYANDYAVSVDIIAAITYIAIFFEKKLNSSIPLYICAAVDLFGLVLTAQVAIKKDIHKYLSKEDTAK